MKEGGRRSEVGGRKREVEAAVDRARALYAKHGLDFEMDRAAYERTGYVIALPNLFAMAKLVALPQGGHAWFVSCAVGELSNLLRFIPAPAEFIAFYRRKTERAGKMKIYRTTDLLRVARTLAP